MKGNRRVQELFEGKIEKEKEVRVGLQNILCMLYGIIGGKENE